MLRELSLDEIMQGPGVQKLWLIMKILRNGRL